MKFIPGRLIFLLITLCLYTSLFAQGPINRLYGTNGTETGKAGVVMSDSSIYALGTSSAYISMSSQVYLIKTDKTGDLLWSKFYGSPAVDDAADMYVQEDTCIYLVSNSYINAEKGYDVKVIKTDPNGNVIWERNFGTTDWDLAKKMLRISDTSFVICGKTYGNSYGLSDGMVMAFDKNGDSLWFKNMGDVYDNEFLDIVRKSNDSLVACGVSMSATGKKRGWINEFSLSNLGDQSHFTGTNYNWSFDCMTMLPTGNYAIGVTLDTSAAAGQNMMILRMHPWSHVQLGHIPIFAGGDEVFADILLTGNRFITLGNTTSFGLGGFDVVVYCFDTLGGYYGGNTFGTVNDNVGSSLATNRQNGFLVVGSSPDTFGPEDLWLINMDAAYYVSPTIDNNFDINNVADIHADQSLVNIYPNPNASGMLNLQSPVPLTMVQLRDNAGRMVMSLEGNHATIDLSGIAAGFYLVSVTDIEGRKGVKRLVIR